MNEVKIPSLTNRPELLVSGRVASTEMQSKLLTDPETGRKFKEIMGAGAFIRGIKNNTSGDIYANLNHGKEGKGDYSKPGEKKLGGTGNSTLSLYEDALGLYSRLQIKKDKFPLLEGAEAFQGWSFEFDIIDLDKWLDEDGVEIHYIKDIVLWGVTLLDNRNVAGAYDKTTVHVRDSSGNARRICCRDISSNDIVIEASESSIIEELRTKAEKLYFSWRAGELIKGISK